MKRLPLRMTGTIAVSVSQWTAKGTVTYQKQVDADIYGPLALHRPIDNGSRTWANMPRWTITHVPSGIAVFSTPSRKRAEAAVRALLALPFDWSVETVVLDREMKRQIRTIYEEQARGMVTDYYGFAVKVSV